MNIIDELFDQIGFQNFQKNFLMKAPCASAQSGKKFKKLIHWPLLAEILEGGHPQCWLAKDGMLSFKNPNSGKLSLTEAFLGFNSGHTLFIRRAEKSHQEIDAIAQKFSQIFKAPLDLQIYCTPANQRGFDWHYDLEEVFVIQSSGEKEFILRKNIQDHPQQFQVPVNGEELFQQMTGPEIRCHLIPGDVLYIPSGYWHRAVAKTDSFHLSVGVMCRQ